MKQALLYSSTIQGGGHDEDGGADRKNPPSPSPAGSLLREGDIGCHPTKNVGFWTVYL